ncbi:MAG: IPT/TIG domain-containing protein [Planctomycetota bacterium]|nr:IPT/TIG domain-containing protein [Planctomycetota bacterium]
MGQVLRDLGGRAVRFALCAALVGVAVAHVRLRYTVDGTALYWENPEEITLVIQADGSDDIGDGSHEIAIRGAMEAWNGASGSRAQLSESLADRDRRDWQANDLNLVVFDENNSSGFFTGASGVVALTPVTFFTDGRIIDADVLFNGKNFSFTTKGEFGRFDVQDVATHELGHLLGLDHTGVCGATMYPYVDTRIILHRSLSLDDQRGMRHMYPASTFARITGRVVREGTSDPVVGAHVWARDVDGRVAGAILTGASGAFTLQGLDAGSYTVFADPLDRPVAGSNLGDGRTIDVAFETATLGAVTVAAGGIASVGVGAVRPDVDVQLGRISDDYPQRLVRGESTTHLVRGTGLAAGSTLTISDPGIALTNVSWSSSWVSFTATTPAGAALGHLDLEVVTPGGERDALVGGFEITPPDPVVASVSPGVGDPAGGTSVTITGSGFDRGARVVIGDRIYRDGQFDGCVVVDKNTIELQTGETIAGDHDVVVIDHTGIEGRARRAFDVVEKPVILSAFPAVGSSLGGTTITLGGTGFVEDMNVTIDGVVQPGVMLDSPTRMRIVTSPGLPGGPYVLRVTSPSGPFAETAFTLVPGSDPRITGVTPAAGDRSGGATISILGAGFDADTRVRFGVNTSTGAGGTAAASVEYVGPGHLRVVTPPSSVGTTSLMVEDDATGQVGTLSAGFTYTGLEPSDRDDGGGCAAAPLPGPPTFRDVIAGAGWILAALALALHRAWSGPRPRVVNAA